MLAISDLVSPWRARSSPRSVGRVTTISPSACSSCIRRGTCWFSSPSGPFTITRPGSSDTDTPAGISMGFLPMRLIQLPDKANNFAADTFALRGLARHQAARCRNDGGAHPAEDTWQAVLASVHTAPRLRDPLQVGDDALSAGAVLQLDHERVEALALLDRVAGDVPLLLEDAGDLLLLARGRHLRALVQHVVRIPDAPEPVGHRFRQQRSPPTNST